MIFSKMHFFVGTIFSFCIISCSGGDPDPLARPTAASGTLDLQTATAMASGLSGTMGPMAEGMLSGDTASSELSGLLEGEFDDLPSKNHSLKFYSIQRTIRTQSLDACEPTVSGNTTDADGDGLPVSANYSLNCSGSREGANISISGTSSIQDKDDTQIFGGFIVSLTNFVFSFDLGQTSSKITTNLRNESTKNADGSFSSTINTATVATGTVNFTGGQYYDITTTPTSGVAEANDSGTINSITGFIKWIGTKDQIDFNVVCAVSGTDISYNESDCGAGHISSGTITLTDGAGNRLEVIHTNCAESYEFNDEAITLSQSFH